MIVKTKGSEYKCDSAKQNGESVDLFKDGEHYLRVSLYNILSVTDGEIEVVQSAPPTELETLESKVAYIAMMNGLTEVI